LRPGNVALEEFKTPATDRIIRGGDDDKAGGCEQVATGWYRTDVEYESECEEVEIDTRNEKINYKVREHSHAKIPAIFVLGNREAEERTVAVRRLGGKQQAILALDEAIHRLGKEAVLPDG